VSTATVSGPADSRRLASGRYEPVGQRAKITLRPFPFAPLILFILGFLLATEIQFVGLVFAGEIALIPAALMSFAYSVRERDGELWKFVGFYSFTLFVYIAADTINGTVITDALRGWARLCFVLVILLGMRPILSQSRFNLFPICAGMLAGYLALKHDLKSAELWKFYAAPVAIASGLYLIAWMSKRFVFLLSCVFLLIAAISFMLIDARAGAAFCLMIAGITAARVAAVRRVRRLLPVLLATGVVLAGLLTFFILNQTNDAYGQRRSGSNVARIAAMITAAETIAQHPLLGVGSWSSSAEAADRHRQITEELGQAYDAEAANQTGHSQILQAFTEAGILAGLAFIYYLWRLLRALRWMLRKPMDRLYAVEFYFLINGLWACLFSGLNGPQRIYVAITICLCILLTEEEKVYNRELARRRNAYREMLIAGIRQGRRLAEAGPA